MKDKILKFFEEHKIKIIVSSSFFFIFISIIFSTLFIPNTFTMATGDPRGNYHKLGLIYKEALEKKGVEVTLVNSQGSVENLELLKDKKVDIAFLQNNLVKKEDTVKHLKGVSSLYNEPIFVFYNGQIKLISELRNKKVSLGKKGSGSYFIAKMMLKMNGLSEQDIIPFYYSYQETKTALIGKKIDAAFMVTSLDNPIVSDLIGLKVQLLNFSNYRSYKFRESRFGAIVIPQGYYNLGENLPSQDIILLTTIATFVSQESFHPRLVEALLMTVSEINEKNAVNLNIEGQNITFPSDEFMDFTLHKASEVYFRDGPSPLTKYFSYNFIFFLSRLKYFLIPLIPFILIFARVIPSFYQFRLSLILKKKYKELTDIEKTIEQVEDKDKLLELDAKLEALKKEMDLVAKRIPSQYHRDIYNWKLHLSMLSESIAKKLQE